MSLASKLLCSVGIPNNMPIFYCSTMPSQLPANYAADGRIVWEISLTAGKDKLGNAFTAGTGLSVWDFDATKNIYEIVNFVPFPDYWGYATRQGAAGMANRNTWFIIDGGIVSSTDAYGYVGRIDIATTPSSTITHVTPSTYRFTHPVNSIDFASKAAGNGIDTACYGYYWGYTSTTKQSFNGWTVKATTGGVYGQVSGAYRTGLGTGDVDYHGQPCVSIVMCGGTAPNNKFIVSASSFDYYTSANLALSDVSTNPITARVATLTYPAHTNSNIGLIPFDATRFLACEYIESSYTGRFSIIYTNSATAPTTLSKGGSCVMPIIPAGVGFVSSDVDLSGGIGYANASNCWFGGNGSVIVWVYYKLLSSSTLAAGDHSYYVYMLAKFTATGTGMLTGTILTTDINGNAIPVLLQTTTISRANYSFNCIGAPGNKAVAMYTDYPSTDHWLQHTIQL